MKNEFFINYDSFIYWKQAEVPLKLASLVIRK